MNGSKNHPYMIRAVYKHPKGRSRCFVFDEQLEFAKFLHCQNQSVQKTPMSMMSFYLLSVDCLQRYEIFSN